MVGIYTPCRKMRNLLLFYDVSLFGRAELSRITLYRNIRPYYRKSGRGGFGTRPNSLLARQVALAPAIAIRFVNSLIPARPDTSSRPSPNLRDADTHPRSQDVFRVGEWGGWVSVEKTHWASGGRELYRVSARYLGLWSFGVGVFKKKTSMRLREWALSHAVARYFGLGSWGWISG